MAVMGGWFFSHLTPETPSLGHSAMLFTSREQGPNPCGTLIQVGTHLYPSPWSSLCSTLSEKAKSKICLQSFLVQRCSLRQEGAGCHARSLG